MTTKHWHCHAKLAPNLVLHRVELRLSHAKVHLALLMVSLLYIVM